MSTMESLIDECGGFGKYQLFLITGIFSHKLAAAWSMLQMAFGAFIPEWYCEVGVAGDNHTLYTNDTLMTCTVNNSDTTGFQEETCRGYTFVGHSETVVSEWGLVCDRAWVKAAITSIQMAGVLVGAMVAGQISDAFGRKKALFGFSLFHALLNFAAAFSISWEMFAAFRFLIGIGIGALLVVPFPYGMEFLPTKWRPLVAVLPDWPLGVCVFALAAYLLDNWFYLHIGCALFNLPPLLGVYHVPESVRWLTLKGRYREAEKIFEQMARVNGRTPPRDTRAVLEKIYQDESMSRSQGRKYTYWDLFKGKRQIKISLIFCWVWLTMSMVYYGLSFAASALAGHLCLNIFLMAILEIPPMFTSFYLTNRIGRKWTCIIFLTCVALPSLGCFILSHTMTSGSSRAQWITALCLVAKMFVAAGSSVARTWVMELHPTVIRSLGFGLSNTAARVGGILSPFAVDLDNNPSMAYILMTSFLTGSVLLLLLVRDTKGKVLSDSITNNEKLIPPSKVINGDLGKGDNHENGDVLEVSLVGDDGADVEQITSNKDELKPMNPTDSNDIILNKV